MQSPNKTSIGRIVHYILNEGPNAGEERPAMIVRVWSDTCVNLQVLTDGTGNYFNDQVANMIWRTSATLDGNKQRGTWHWPEVETEIEAALPSAAPVVAAAGGPTDTPALRVVETVAASALSEAQIERIRAAQGLINNMAAGAKKIRDCMLGGIIVVTDGKDRLDGYLAGMEEIGQKATAGLTDLLNGK